jgi:hypothetical protein
MIETTAIACCAALAELDLPLLEDRWSLLVIGGKGRRRVRSIIGKISLARTMSTPPRKIRWIVSSFDGIEVSLLTGDCFDE